MNIQTFLIFRTILIIKRKVIAVLSAYFSILWFYSKKRSNLNRSEFSRFPCRHRNLQILRLLTLSHFPIHKLSYSVPLRSKWLKVNITLFFHKQGQTLHELQMYIYIYMCQIYIYISNLRLSLQTYKAILWAEDL